MPMVFGVDEGTISNVAVASLVTYIISEGRDCHGAKHLYHLIHMQGGSVCG